MLMPRWCLSSRLHGPQMHTQIYVHKIDVTKLVTLLCIHTHGVTTIPTLVAMARQLALNIFTANELLLLLTFV